MSFTNHNCLETQESRHTNEQEQFEYTDHSISMDDEVGSSFQQNLKEAASPGQEITDGGQDHSAVTGMKIPSDADLPQVYSCQFQDKIGSQCFSKVANSDAIRYINRNSDKYRGDLWYLP